MMNEDTYTRLSERYDSGRVPWDDPLPPPEVAALSERLPAGRALDLGCGYGRASLFLADRGWQVAAVDFMPQAIKEATARARAAGLASRIHFHLARVSELGFLEGPFDLALDVGCLHSLPAAARRDYFRGLRRLLPAGAAYLLFVHLADELADGEDNPRGMPEAELLWLLADGFALRRAEYGLTQVEDRPPWQSAWFWCRRR